MASRLRAVVCTTAAVLVLPLLTTPPASALAPAVPQAAVARAAAAPTATAPSPLLQRIRRLGIVAKATELRGAPRGTRFFRITVSLPVDHARPDGPTFGLRVNLLHRGFDRPTVVETAGYQLWNDPYRSEVTRIVDGNQIDIEHRFFAPSLPENPDWATQLTIRQAADDHHRVISAFRKLYDGRWLSTGDSKGGMAATYHRRWYPSDVTATIAYVAPHDAVDDDDAYPAFLARVGGPRLDDCRDRLVALQRRMLQQRGWFRARLERLSAAGGFTWRYVGSLDRGLEASVIDLYFALWQYWGAEACASVPAARRLSNGEVWRYAGLVNPWSNLSDQRRFYSAPYHYQAAAQIGGPKPYEARLRDLLEYPGANTPANILPPALEPVPHDATAMADIDAWMRSSARRMLFVNGQFDPWAAEPFRCGAGGRDRSCRSVTVPRGSHNALIGDLPRRARLGAVRQIRRWAGLPRQHSRTRTETLSSYDGARWIPELDGRYLRYVRGGRRSPAPPRLAGGLQDRIERIGIVDRVKEVPGAGPRFFRIWFRLPVDHADPDGPTFTLRATLLHRGTGRPMVIKTSGYGLGEWHYPIPTEVTSIVGGNQLTVEHRFFRPSRPADPDWATQLTIRQSAADQHRIVRALQRIYDRRWISTGASKGGMTMTYHRRFYPDDVDGTVAYVAPDDVVDADDAYGDFQAGVGGAAYAECRSDLVAVQRRILANRDWFRTRLREYVASNGYHLGLIDSADHGIEVTVIELYFAFWQYQIAEEACPDVPAASASRMTVWNWVDGVYGWWWVTNEALRHYVPYYYQAATQLGSPAPYQEPVADLLHHPGYDVPATFVPDGLEPLTFDASAMPDIDRWVRTSASEMLFVYGELDPWSAETFACGAGGKDRQCFVRWVPGGNHGADVRSLPDDARRAAIARIRRWAGVSTQAAAIDAAERRAERAGPTVEQRTAVPGG